MKKSFIKFPPFVVAVSLVAVHSAGVSAEEKDGAVGVVRRVGKVENEGDIVDHQTSAGTNLIKL
jgi:hypothetical protein